MTLHTVPLSSDSDTAAFDLDIRVVEVTTHYDSPLVTSRLLCG